MSSSVNRLGCHTQRDFASSRDPALSVWCPIKFVVSRFGSNDLFHLPSLGTQFAIARKQIPGVTYHRGWLHLNRKAADS